MEHESLLLLSIHKVAAPYSDHERFLTQSPGMALYINCTTTSAFPVHWPCWLELMEANNIKESHRIPTLAMVFLIAWIASVAEPMNKRNMWHWFGDSPFDWWQSKSQIVLSIALHHVPPLQCDNAFSVFHGEYKVNLTVLLWNEFCHPWSSLVIGHAMWLWGNWSPRTSGGLHVSNMCSRYWWELISHSYLWWNLNLTLCSC